jgi:hypothetical protein
MSRYSWIVVASVLASQSVAAADQEPAAGPHTIGATPAGEKEQPSRPPQGLPTGASPGPSGAANPPESPVQAFTPEDVTAPTGPSSPSPATPATTQEEAGFAPLTMDEIPVISANARVTVNMFGDAGFRLQTSFKPAFTLGPLDLLLTGQFANLMAMAEANLETDPETGAVGIDLERMFVRWRSERFVIDAGRTHTELGYWNNAFHHGRWLQLPIERPHIVEFEDSGGLLPVHWVGVTGRLRALVGERQLDVIGSVGNGRGNIIDDVRVTDDTNDWKAVLLKVEARGFGARDLYLGVSGIFDRIAPLPALSPTGGAIRPALPDVTIGELIANAYVAYRGPELTIIAEAYDIHHQANGQKWNTFDPFLLLGYRIGQWVPFVLGEARMGDVASDPFFFPVPGAPLDATYPRWGRVMEGTGGLRWDLNTWSAVKFEYRATRPLPKDSTSLVQRFMIDWTFGL